MASGPDKLQAFLGKAVGDLGAAVSAALMLIGDELGLYRELAKGRLTPAELAGRTGTSDVMSASGSVTRLPVVTSITMPSPAPISSTTNRRYVWPIPRGRSICRAPIWWSRICSMSLSARLRIFAPAEAWNGASIIDACFTGPSGFPRRL